MIATIAKWMIFIGVFLLGNGFLIMLFTDSWF